MEEQISLTEVTLLTPCLPSKFTCLWSNYRALAEKLDQAVPSEPLYLLKSPASHLAAAKSIKSPRGYDGRVTYEGELGIVIGQRCIGVSMADAGACILGYTCVIDMTALDILTRDPVSPNGRARRVSIRSARLGRPL